MAVGASSLGGQPAGQVETDNPALSLQAFERGRAQLGAAEGRMTAGGTYAKTGLLLGILILAAAFGWSQVEIIQVDTRVLTTLPPWTWLAFLLTFVLGIVGTFAFRAIPIIAPLYALSQGALLGVGARYFDLVFDGIVLQAVLATVCVFGVTLLLYSTGVIKVTSRLVLGVVLAMGGLVLLFMTSWLLSLFGLEFHFLFAPTPLGILLCVGVVILGALNLPIDFEFIRQAAAQGAPKTMEWFGAYGLMLSIIWMYVSILRLLALLRMTRR